MHTSRQPQPTVAIVGAGISGLICARTLAVHGFKVAVFEKSRGVGGRMATRRTREGPRFDHGAQYFTVRDARFEHDVESWIQDGVVKPWHGRIATLTGGPLQWKQEPPQRFVGVPGMNAICKHLARDLQVRFQTHVGPPEKLGGDWQLTDASGQPLGKFDWFITSAPAPQSATLLAAAPDLALTARQTRMTGCWAVMLAFEQSLGLPFDAAFVHESPLAWIARNDTKPGREHKPECWVLHASPEWTTRYIESDPEQVHPPLIEAFRQATGAPSRPPIYQAAHRWRFAIPPEPLPQRSLFDSKLQIGGCGDWCSGPRVEGAFLSGKDIADRVLTHLLK